MNQDTPNIVQTETQSPVKIDELSNLTLMENSDKKSIKLFIKYLKNKELTTINFDVFGVNSDEYKYIISAGNEQIKLDKKNLFAFLICCGQKLYYFPAFSVNKRSYDLLLKKDYLSCFLPNNRETTTISLLLVNKMYINGGNPELREFLYLDENPSNVEYPYLLKYKKSLQFSSIVTFYKNLYQFYENEKINAIDFLRPTFIRQLCGKNNIIAKFSYIDFPKFVVKHEMLSKIKEKEKDIVKIDSCSYTLWTIFTYIGLFAFIAMASGFCYYREQHLEKIPILEDQIAEQNSTLISLASNFTEYKTSHVCGNNEIECFVGQFVPILFNYQTLSNVVKSRFFLGMVILVNMILPQYMITSNIPRRRPFLDLFLRLFMVSIDVLAIYFY